jgi:hypothetical protein
MYYSDPNPQSSIQYIFNNQSYFRYSFQSYVYIAFSNGTTQSNFTTIPVIPCQSDSWAQL